MKKTLAIMILAMLTIFSMLSFFTQQTTAEILIFEDDFESYDVGTFPNPGGWELIFNGMGTQYQIVTDSVSYSPAKSLQLWGKPNWSALAMKAFVTEAEIIGYEVYVRIEESTTDTAAYMSFYNRTTGSPWGAHAGRVVFAADGKIVDDYGLLLGMWFPDNWYKVRVELDIKTNRFNVWINDELKGEDLITEYGLFEIEALQLQSEHAGVQAYFDDVEIFEVLPAVSVTIDIDPDTLNLKSEGRWITGYIELPEGYDLNDINVSTILLNDTIPVDLDTPTEIGDYDNDGIPDLMVKFDRDEVISLIESNLNTRERVCTVALTITGKLYDGTPFQGRDSIRVLILRKGDPIPR